jgi:dTDP-4-dehydrorhamnose reductase
VTRNTGHYEPGVFDSRSSQPRPTILAKAIYKLNRGQDFDHPVLDVPGWWRRPERLLYPPVPRRDEYAFQKQNFETGQVSNPKSLRKGTDSMVQSSLLRRSAPRVLLIIGAKGTLGDAFRRTCDLRGLPYRLASRQEIDITDRGAVERMLAEVRPWTVINAAGYVRVDEAEREQDLCRRANTDGPANLAFACAHLGIQFLTFSSDLVFDGSQSIPYFERSQTAPLNVYGCSKAESEKLVFEYLPDALVIRTSAFFGPWDNYNFATHALRALVQGLPFVAANDTYISPTFVPDLVNASLDLLIDQEFGLWHLSNSGEVTWLEFARATADAAGLDPAQIEGRPMEELNLLARRPRYSVLGSERGVILPGLENAIGRYCQSLSLA